MTKAHLKIVCAMLLTILSAQAVSSGSITSDSVSSDNISSDGIEENVSSDVYIYVNNKDDDRQEISLLVDSELKGTEEVGSGEEKKFGSFLMKSGEHTFKIAWRDEDTRKSYEEELSQNVEAGNSVMLYTEKHDAPEKFDVAIFAKNDCDRDLDAYLWIDESFEKTKEVSKGSTADLGKIKMEEGLHEVSIHWQDPTTDMEYEKRKKINVQREEAVTFLITEGISFESKEEVPPRKPSSRIEDSSISSHSEPEVAEAIGNDSKNLSRSEEESPVEKSAVNSEISTDSSFVNKSADSLEFDERFYLYAILVAIAVYLLFRH